MIDNRTRTKKNLFLIHKIMTTILDKIYSVYCTYRPREDQSELDYLDFIKWFLTSENASSYRDEIMNNGVIELKNDKMPF